MTRVEEIKERLDHIADSLFYIDMKDRWTDRDWERMADLKDEKEALLKELKELEK